jgi:hypothetical protein
MMVRHGRGVEYAGKITTTMLSGTISAMGLLLKHDRARRICFDAAPLQSLD